MKKFLHKMNRGIVLFLILLIGFCVFVIIQTKNFQTEKQEIMKLCDEFCKETSEVLTTPQSCYKKSDKLTDEQTKLLDENLQKYMSIWTTADKIDSIEYYTGANEMEKIIKEATEENALTNGYIESMLYTLGDDIYIQRMSDTYATANFSVKYTIKHNNYVRVPLAKTSDDIYNGYEQPDVYKTEENKYETAEKTLTQKEFDELKDSFESAKTKTYLDTNYNIYFKKTADGWKVAYCEISIYGEGTTQG